MEIKPLKEGSIERFRSDEFSLKNSQRSGRPFDVDEAHIKAVIDSNRHSITRDIAEKFNLSHTCIKKKFKTLGYVNKLDLWIPHQLKEIHLTQRISICDSLLKCNENDPFLKNLVTGDEKWIVYNNVTRKRSWVKQDQPAQTVSKAEIHQKKIMLSVWWDHKGILYFELMPQNQTINSNVYVEQLEKLKDAIEEKRPALSNWKVLFSIMITQGPTHLWLLGKNNWNWVEMFCHTHHIALALRLPITICFVPFKTL